MMQLLSSVKRRMSNRDHNAPPPEHVPTPTAAHSSYTRTQGHFIPSDTRLLQPGRPDLPAPFLPASDDSDTARRPAAPIRTPQSTLVRSAPVPKSEPPPLNVSPRTSSAKLAEETPDPAPPETKKRSSAAPKEDAPTPLPPGFLVRKADPNVFEKEPCLRDISFPGDVLEALRRKLRACSDVVFDFRAADLYLEQKEQKKQTLMEVLDYINNSERKPVPLEQIIEELIEMISANIFRPLPPPSTSVSSLLLNDPEELEPMMEVAWPHLQLIYEILLRLVMCSEINPKVAKKHIDHCFVLKLLDLFASEDPRERDYLKTIMHRVYGKIMALRAFIRKAIQHVFFRYIHENESQFGVSELLEILGSIINGFAQPLKEEHKLFLIRSMVPLHKSRQLVSYHQQLTYCMTQYIEKENRLVEPIVKGLLRYWPVTNTPKEVLFLNEIEEILELTPPSEFTKIMEPLFRRMALCIQSPHFQVSERVLFLWNNPRIVKLINQNKNLLFPIVIGALYKNTRDHWNVTVHGLTFNVCKLLAEADPHLFDHCNDENLLLEERRQTSREMRSKQWTALRANYQEKISKDF